jgi:hypothetical protein
MYRISSMSGNLLSGEITSFGEAQETAEDLELQLDLVCVIQQLVNGKWVRVDPVMDGGT